MFYEVTPSEQPYRYFSSQVRYSQIDWSKLDAVVDAFKLRLDDWYLGPARELAQNIHSAFSVMALNCLLIDALSQFVAGELSSTGSGFKRFIRTRLPPAYYAELPTPIRHYDGSRPEQALCDVADVLYHGFRCGILHQAHISPYGGIIPQAPAIRIEQSGAVRYKDSQAACPSVIVDPLTMLADLSVALDMYLRELKDRDANYDALRDAFRKKFSSSFGVDVYEAV